MRNCTGFGQGRLPVIVPSLLLVAQFMRILGAILARAIALPLFRKDT